MNRVLASASRPLLRAASTTYRPLISAGVRFNSSHDGETFQDFSKRYTAFFENAEDLFELQRGLNNCFAYDLVPGVDVIEAALRASRRLDTYSTAVRILEGVKEKVENPKQYDAYLEELKGVREELGEYCLVPSWLAANHCSFISFLGSVGFHFRQRQASKPRNSYTLKTRYACSSYGIAIWAGVRRTGHFIPVAPENVDVLPLHVMCTFPSL